MAFSIKYKPLFTVNVLHNYFLNKGAVLYSSMTAAEKEHQLELANFRQYISILPTAETQQILNGYGLVFRLTNTTFSVWCKVDGDDVTPTVSLEDDLQFIFLLQLKDRLFYNYTNLKMENSGKIYFLSNRKLATEPITFPLIKKAGASSKLDESFILTPDSQKAEMGKLLHSEKNNLLALIRIYMKGNTSALHVTGTNGKIKDPMPVFEIQFDNRKTTWRYLFRTNQVVKGSDDVKKEGGSAKILITKTEQPLTQNGFISIELGGVDLPNPEVNAVKPDTSDNKYYSEIYM